VFSRKDLHWVLRVLHPLEPSSPRAPEARFAQCPLYCALCTPSISSLYPIFINMWGARAWTGGVLMRLPLVVCLDGQFDACPE
ncbi:MAG: hypothetical protein AAF518_26925, partial [Spirochaetota bacterium]